MLRERRSVTVAALEQQFGVSPMTARRDLSILARQGRARRTHGGAILPDLASHEDSFRHRLQQDVDAKQRLAKAVVETLSPSETIFIDSSTTAYFVAETIVETGLGVTVLTNSLSIMSRVGSTGAANVELVGLGGTLRTLTHSFVGSDTVRALQGYLVDRVVFSVKGITSEGFLTDADPLEAEVKRAMIDHAQTAILLATPQKFEDHGLSVVAHAGRVHVAYVIDCRDSMIEILERAGTDVYRVQ